ncbi:peroxiredoxin family protein [Mongoliitalea daihaiensis]|uniref:peroxiredoxin family protein n=1 Tax=Mongoliitalea daihaiensis TaxID=2782006 RepID=UPI001F1A1533|nr:TlpA disulfide reductase family protein [Mongoliitalea daihaiensis]UJP64319.1 TlpA family protein disulfide reductase [Mongoliitalea daihaiensis]
MKQLSKLFFSLVFVISFGCSSSSERSFDGQVEIKASLQNADAGQVKISKFIDDNAELVTTIEVSGDGKFSYTLALTEPGFYEVDLMGKKSVRLALYDQDVKIIYDFNDANSLVLDGSEDSQHMLAIERLTEEYQEQINQLNTAYMEAMNNRDTDKIKDIQDIAISMESNQSQKVKELIASMDNSFAAMAALGMINIRNDFQFVDELIQSLDKKYPNVQMIQNVLAQLDDMRSLAIGQMAPEIELPNPEGELVKLSDLRGKYVLIDFWAAWCRPCREENPNVVRLFNQYNSQGFEVFGVSLDRTKEAWVKAIEDDQLTWTHVSDLKYFNSAAAATYQINAIPATYLIGPDGTIVAKDLRGNSLENKLKEIFG